MSSDPLTYGNLRYNCTSTTPVLVLLYLFRAFAFYSLELNSFRGEKRLPSKREPQVLPSIEGTHLPFLVFAHAKIRTTTRRTHTHSGALPETLNGAP